MIPSETAEHGSLTPRASRGVAPQAHPARAAGSMQALRPGEAGPALRGSRRAAGAVAKRRPPALRPGGLKVRPQAGRSRPSAAREQRNGRPVPRSGRPQLLPLILLILPSPVPQHHAQHQERRAEHGDHIRQKEPIAQLFAQSDLPARFALGSLSSDLDLFRLA